MRKNAAIFWWKNLSSFSSAEYTHTGSVKIILQQLYEYCKSKT